MGTKYHKKLTLMILLGTSMSLAPLLIAPKLIFWWVESYVHPSYILLSGLSIWTVIGCCGDAIAMFWNGASAIRFQVIVVSIFGIACLVVKITFIRTFSLGSFLGDNYYLYFSHCIPTAINIPRLLRGY